LEYDKVLESHLLIEKKRDGKIKIRLVAGGNKQREFLYKSDVGSPTVSSERIFLTAVINAKENRDVATCDLPNAFVQTKMQGTVHMRLRGELAKKLMIIDPAYKKHVIFNRKGEPIVYVVLQKALYGIMQAALLFYNKLVKDLLEYGFVLNNYDCCVANKMINGHQMTIIWHVDDLMISHREPSEVTKKSIG